MPSAEIITNGSFVSGITGWASASTFFTNPGATLTWNGTDSHDDTHCMQVDTNGVSLHEGITQTVTGLSANTVYWVSAWVRAVSGLATPVLEMRDTTNLITAPDSKFIVAASNVWTMLSVTITTGATGPVSLLISVNAATNSGVSQFLVDQVTSVHNPSGPFLEFLR